MGDAMNGQLLRLLDANCNRAREALRVLEDYARFVLDDAELSLALKQLRHDLGQATGAWADRAILYRDTPRDVGVANKTPGEQTRSDTPHVVVAAGKRLGEALRSIEEYLKVVAPAQAATVESARYRLYTLEQRIHQTLHPAERFGQVRLYVLITASICRRPWMEVAEQALLGGADCLQLREKELDASQVLARARLLAQICHRHKALCILNDRPDLALLSGADGVHVGQQDLAPADARRIVGPDKIVGVSTHDLEQARAAQAAGADYVGIGPCFVSGTKRRDFVAGPDLAGEVARSTWIPAVAIAGIDRSNVGQLLAAGVRAIAVTADVCAADDPRQAAAELKDLITAKSI